jgi:thioesterase domain-containing protein
MLVPIETSGNKPPLFFVHGSFGYMPLGPTIARVLGPDQPLYAINANGIDGQQSGLPAIDNMHDMVTAYAEEIAWERPYGPIFVGGMCRGCIAAIEIARKLQEVGRKVGPVILVDPPVAPGLHNPQNNTIDVRQPEIAQQLYNSVRFNILRHAKIFPNGIGTLNIGDADQLHVSTLAGVGALVAFDRYLMPSFSGPVDLIVSADRAVSLFDPNKPWRTLLPGPRIVHVLPFKHHQLFLPKGIQPGVPGGLEYVAGLIKLVNDETEVFESVRDQV